MIKCKTATTIKSAKTKTNKNIIAVAKIDNSEIEMLESSARISNIEMQKDEIRTMQKREIETLKKTLICLEAEEQKNSEESHRISNDV